MTIHDEYRAKHPRSAALWERARRAIPGGITHDIRHLAPFPTYVEQAAGTVQQTTDQVAGAVEQTTGEVGGALEQTTQGLGLGG